MMARRSKHTAYNAVLDRLRTISTQFAEVGDNLVDDSILPETLTNITDPDTQEAPSRFFEMDPSLQGTGPRRFRMRFRIAPPALGTVYVTIYKGMGSADLSWNGSAWVSFSNAIVFAVGIGFLGEQDLPFEVVLDDGDPSTLMGFEYFSGWNPGTLTQDPIMAGLDDTLLEASIKLMQAPYHTELNQRVYPVLFLPEERADVPLPYACFPLIDSFDIEDGERGWLTVPWEAQVHLFVGDTASDALQSLTCELAAKAADDLIKAFKGDETLDGACQDLTILGGATEAGALMDGRMYGEVILRIRIKQTVGVDVLGPE